MRRFDSDRDAFVAELGAAYREWGFCGVSHHGIPAEAIDGAYQVFKEFFALPEQTKRKYHVPGSGGARGYTPFGIETAKDSQYPDLKEFFHIGRELPDGSRYREFMPPNLWPTEVPGFREHAYGLFQALDSLGSRVLSALATAHRLACRFLRRQDQFRQLDPSPHPLPADHFAGYSERARRRPRGHQPDHPAGRRERGRP